MTQSFGDMLCGWSFAVLLTVMCVVVWTSIERFQDPVGEKHMEIMPPGNADFVNPFNGARALLMGVNPYTNDVPELADPWHRRFTYINVKEYRGLYPPTHFILYVPLALATDNWRQAGRILFVVNVAALLLLSILAWWLIAHIRDLSGQERQWSMLLILAAFVILTGNTGSSYALERGNGGDVLAAAFCWTALVLFMNERYFLSMFLMVPATFTKGYALLCGIGLTLLCMSRGNWRYAGSAIAGIVAGLGIFVLPVLRYVPDALTWLLHNEPLPGWYLFWNHGFLNVFYHLAPEWAEPLTWMMSGYCLLLTVMCWLYARRALRERDTGQALLWCAFFVTLSLETMLGNAPFSYIYNLVLVLPGVLVFFLIAPSLAKSHAFSKWMVHAVGAINVVSAFLVFKFVLFEREDLPWPGIGMILFLISIGIAVMGLRPGRRVAEAIP